MTDFELEHYAMALIGEAVKSDGIDSPQPPANREHRLLIECSEQDLAAD